MKNERIPEADDHRDAGGSKGSSRRLLLLVLLLLVMTFGYLYFFTGLIKPHEEEAKAPPVQTVQVKKPIPPRPDQAAANPDVTAKTEEKKPIQTKVEKPATPPPAPVKPAAPLAQQAGTKPPAAPVAKPATVTKQPLPVKVAKAETPPAGKEHGKAQPAAMPPAKPQPKGAAKPAKVAKPVAVKTPAQAKTERQVVKPAARQGAYTLLVGEYAVEREMKNRRASLKKLGVTPIRGIKTKKTETMYRLYLSDFDTHYAADLELQKLQQIAGSAFILGKNGRFAVYAGSYLHKHGADAERRRLAGKGFKLIIKTAKVKMPVTRITAGSFSSSEDAEKEAGRLRSSGINAAVIKAGKSG